tara:strand:- start:469 stop:732 length:264 start_codon:yes stop_codon:yes gene_type:complete
MKAKIAYAVLAKAIHAAPSIPPCQTTDHDLWFIEPGYQASVSFRDARKLCAICPVQKECLEYAVIAEEAHGLWGGLSPKERRKLTNV